MDASKTLEGLSIVPVVVIEDINHAVKLANVLYEAGFAAIEVTLRTSCALSAIEEIVKNVPPSQAGQQNVHVTMVNNSNGSSKTVSSEGLQEAPNIIEPYTNRNMQIEGFATNVHEEANDFKDCPFCAETVKLNAVLYRAL